MGEEGGQGWKKGWLVHSRWGPFCVSDAVDSKTPKKGLQREDKGCAKALFVFLMLQFQFLIIFRCKSVTKSVSRFGF